MKVLAVTHGPNVGPGVFGEAVRAAGHELETWCVPLGGEPPGTHEAVLVFGGAMHPDQDEQHPWLRREHRFLEGLLEQGTPLLGVCLGAQLIAKAAAASVHPARQPEVGWLPVEQVADDPVLDVLPRRFDAFQWHHYTYEVPAGATELARSDVSTQAFRLGAALGIQFHAEVTAGMVASWLAEDAGDVTDPDELRRATAERIEGWNELGRALCGRFLAAI
ncbi:MAG: type 1 glutamine amidotransferase [Actinobacteria bacterium]|nr:type 1 glutamine amidotransferase [Actinomycetota bacterium]